jgi:hypothetical protein
LVNLRRRRGNCFATSDSLSHAAAAAGDGKLSDDAVRLLAGLLRRGRPLVYVTSEAIDATNLVHLQSAMACNVSKIKHRPPKGRAGKITAVGSAGPPCSHAAMARRSLRRQKQAAS